MAVTTKPPLPNRKPPYAEETEDSRIGLTTGIYGADNITRTFRVYCVATSENPVATLTSLSSANGGVKLLESFPMRGGWGDGSYVVLYFRILDHWQGTAIWIVQAVYGPSYLTGYQSSQWEFSLASSLETERIFTTWRDENDPAAPPAKGIGQPAYYPFAPVVGPPVPGSSIFTARSPAGKVIQLMLPGGGSDPTSATLPRYVDGADRPKALSVINLWKTIPAWNYPAVATAMQNRRYVNSDTVTIETTSGSITWVDENDGGLGTLLLAHVGLDPVRREESGLPGDPNGGPAFRVTLVLKFNPDGWDLKRNHSYRDQAEGWEVPILNPQGNPVVETFQLNGSTSFSGLIGAFV